MNNLKLMMSKMAVGIPYAVFISDGFNCRSSQWWKDENENEEGKRFEPLTSDFGIYQFINEPTHMIGESKSCINLIFTHQPNIVLDSGVHPPFHEQCHHQIVYGRLSTNNHAHSLIHGDSGTMTGPKLILSEKASRDVNSENLFNRFSAPTNR